MLFPSEWYVNNACPDNGIARKLVLDNTIVNPLTNEEVGIKLNVIVDFNRDARNCQEAKLEGAGDASTEHMALAKYSDGTVFVAFWSDLLVAQGAYPAYAIETFPDERALRGKYMIEGPIMWLTSDADRVQESKEILKSDIEHMERKVDSQVRSLEEIDEFVREMETIFGKDNVKIKIIN